jgi:PQQ-dependent catabolism-associated beta-propeller protein
LYRLPSGEDPEQFALHPNNRELFIANEDDSVTTIVDTQTHKVIKQIDVGVEPEGMAFSPDGKIAITTSETTNMAHWIDTTTYEIFANTLVDPRPRHAEFTHKGDQLWVSSEIGGTVSIFSVSDQANIGKIAFAIPGVHKDDIQPVGIVIDREDKLAYVALGPANHIAVVDIKTQQVLDYILVGKRVWHMAFSGDEGLLFSTNGVSGDVTVIDVASRSPIKSIKVGRYPWGAAFRRVQ